MIPRLTNELKFPHPSTATDEGIVAYDGDLSMERLELAYRSGIFPWFNEGEIILWWSPDPRMVLFPAEFKMSKSLRKTIRKNVFTVTFNQDFVNVITACSKIKRAGQAGTWITNKMIGAYIDLHKKGVAQSVEVWQAGVLVGGLYGVNLEDEKIFCGESMFSTVSDASKVGFYYLVQRLKSQDYNLIDCQMHTQHLESLGAKEIDRVAFLTYLM